MSLTKYLIALILLAFVTTSASCNRRRPHLNLNRSPTILSLTAAPTDIAVTDSALVTCMATDPDGDSLVYDWDTDLRLRIRGAPPNYPTKTNTLNNAEMFYPNYSPSEPDTVFVACSARDRKGGSAIRVITFTVRP